MKTFAEFFQDFFEKHGRYPEYGEVWEGAIRAYEESLENGEENGTDE